MARDRARDGDGYTVSILEQGGYVVKQVAMASTSQRHQDRG